MLPVLRFRPSALPQSVRRVLRAGAVLGLVLALVPAVRAQEPEAESPGPREEIAAQRAEMAERIEALRSQLQARPADAAMGEDLEEELALAERIDRLLRDQDVAIQRAGELSGALAEAEAQLAAGPESQLSAEPPYPLPLLDGLWDVLEQQRRRLAQLEDATSNAEEALAATRRRVEERERQRRSAREALEESPSDDAATQARLRRDLRLAELESRLAEARRRLGELEVENARSSLALQQKSEALIRATVRWVGERLSIDRTHLAAPLKAIERARFEVDQALRRGRRELAQAERRVEAAESRLALAGPGDAAAAAELAARQQAEETALRRIDHLEQELARLDSAAQWWERRFRILADEAAREEIRLWSDEVRAEIEDREREQTFLEARRAELGLEQARLTERLAVAREKGEPRARWLEQQQVELAGLVGLVEQEGTARRSHLALLRRVRRELDDRTGRFSPAERLKALGDDLAEAWNTELLAVEDEPITPGKIVTALVLVVAGLALSRRMAHWGVGWVRRRAGVDAGGAAALESLTFYVLLLGFLLLALDVASIPLTVFTFVGGALAIGVGFGSQNIVNNFISGLILLVERPIKSGDLVDVAGTLGFVEHIGARSTVVRTFDNTNIIVPNSTFLETNVVNWTLSNPVVRCTVAVGVAYGSPVREVERQLDQIARDQEDILRDPPPFVRFEDFGDNSLLFKLYFWIRMGGRVDRLRLQSDVRFAIDERFRKAGIEIAFPQRDVHLKSGGPVRVQMLPPEDGS